MEEHRAEWSCYARGRRLYLYLAVLALLPSPGLAKKGPPPGGLAGVPGLGGLGGGPPWRKAIGKVFDEACEIREGTSVFCFPNKKELIEALQVEQYGLELTDETFLMDLHVVVQQLLLWPPSWMDLIDVLSPKRGWTGAFCDKIIGSEWWQAVPVVRKSFVSPRQTLTQLEVDSPKLLGGLKRWLDVLRDAQDSQIRRLVKEFRESDKADAKNNSVHSRPLMRLMQQVHAKTVQHIIGKACKGSKAALAKFKKGDSNGLTLLHHAASLGDMADAKAILRGFPKAERAPLLARRDNWGYTAEDWARLGDFPELAEALRGPDDAAPTEPAGASAPVEPVRLFPAAGDDASPGTSQCSGDSSSATCSTADAGGWNLPTAEEVPPEWMPPPDSPCFADTINVAQFDFDTFMKHYLLHPRPLLIRGGAQFPPPVLASYSRAGLLEAAGEQKVAAERFPEAGLYDRSKPVKKLLREYVESLGERSGSGSAKKKLHYLYYRLSRDEVALNFSATMPDILAGKVDQGTTHFYVGGLFMGVPPHHHAPAVNSLVHGSKLWFLEPPGREVIVQETAYSYLARTGGAPGSLRCLQQAGDVLFVPRAWTHSTICLGDCVGVSHEFSHEKWDLRD